MKIVADLHIHSRYAYACSKDLTLPNLSSWAQKKGINLLGTGDFTHPKWMADLEASLVEANPGIYKLPDKKSATKFILSTEIACVYKQGDKTRRVHNLIYAPDFAAAKRLVATLKNRNANLASDGRPIIGLSGQQLLTLCKESDPRIELIPAHIWTPHFGVFGSLSGFDSLEECYGDMAQYIFAAETGLSSDPKMNWNVPKLKDITLISNSDAHSLRKLGREANVLEIGKEILSYAEVMRIIKEGNPHEFVETLEFFPEEGKYHLDGHRDHTFSCTPEETERYGGVCPVCKKKLLRGVLSRVSDLSQITTSKKRSIGARQIPYKSIIPLEEIIGETIGVGVVSKKVQSQYEAMVAALDAPPFDSKGGWEGLSGEFAILLSLSEEQLTKISTPHIAESIMRVRRGKVAITPGYDGVFGKIKIYSDAEREKLFLKPKQSTLF